jgi:hypothetical protein
MYKKVFNLKFHMMYFFLSIMVLPASYEAMPASAASLHGAVFKRYIDRTEGAFILMVPRGWKTQGGIRRLNAMTAAGGPGNATDAKLDFAVMRDAKVGIRWLPKINYAQPSPGNAMLNGNWNGMPVVAMPGASEYLTGMLFPAIHRGAGDVKVLKIERRPDAIAGLEKSSVAVAMRSQGGRYVADAATVTVSYQEGGVRYREIMFVALEGYEYMGSGLWDNPITIVARAPEAEYAGYAPTARVIINSFSLNPRWLQAELKGQANRAALVSATLRDISRIDAEIAKNRSETMSAINFQEYLTLTNQERYLNPFTGEKELGSSEWKYRWVNSSGEPIYTDDKNWNPNNDPSLHVSGYKLSPAK